MRKYGPIRESIPYRSVKIINLALSCPVCKHVRAGMEAIGYTLPLDEESERSGRVKFVIQEFHKNNLTCQCLIDHLRHNPVIDLYDSNIDGQFN